MPNKILASNVAYQVHRIGHITRVTATLQASLLSKFDFEPIENTSPPIYKFYEVLQSIPFFPEGVLRSYSEDIFYPKSAKTLHIEDANGFHSVRISELDIPDINVSDRNRPGQFCVFQGADGQKLIAPCNARVPAGYDRVFGPASFEACANF